MHCSCFVEFVQMGMVQIHVDEKIMLFLWHQMCNYVRCSKMFNVQNVQKCFVSCSSTVPYLGIRMFYLWTSYSLPSISCIDSSIHPSLPSAHFHHFLQLCNAQNVQGTKHLESRTSILWAKTQTVPGKNVKEAKCL